MTDIDTVPETELEPDGGEPPAPTSVEDSEQLGAHPARVGTLLLVLAAMAILGGWELLAIVMAIVVFIIIHELGHYLTAKWSGMKVTEFFIGFGPRIIAYKRGETTYGLKAIPLGAYVRIIGMNNLEDVDPSEEDRAYRSKSWHKRFITTAAGPATHFLIAIVLAAVAIWQFGEPVEDEWEIGAVVPFSAADQAGLEAGDRILALNGTPTDEFDTLADMVQGVRGEIVELEVERDGEVTTVTPRIGERLTAEGSSGLSGLYFGDLILGFDGQPVANYADFVTLAEERVGEKVEIDVVYDGSLHTELVTINRVATGDDAVIGFLGVAEGEVRVPLPLGEAVAEAPGAVGRGTGELASRFADMFTSREGLSALFALPSTADPDNSVIVSVNDPEQIRPRAEIDENRLLSIVGAVGIGKQLVDDGLAVVLFFFVGLNISLALLNLLPLLPFDGGHMAIATYERLRSFGGRHHRVDAEKMLPLTYAVVAFVMLVGMIAIIRDIVDPIQL